MKKTPFKMNPGFDALPGRVQAKIKGRPPNRFFGKALSKLFGSVSKGSGMGALQVGRKLMGSNNLGMIGMAGGARNAISQVGGAKGQLMNKLQGGLKLGSGAIGMIGKAFGRRR